MPPISAKDNVYNSLITDIVEGCILLASHFHPANMANLIISKNSMTIPHATRRIVTVFCITVSRVVGGRPKPQMIDIYASRVVAGMADKHSRWNWSFRLFPHNAMNAAWDVAKRAIAVFVFVTLPYKTTSNLISFGAKRDVVGKWLRLKFFVPCLWHTPRIDENLNRCKGRA